MNRFLSIVSVVFLGTSISLFGQPTNWRYPGHGMCYVPSTDLPMEVLESVKRNTEDSVMIWIDGVEVHNFEWAYYSTNDGVNLDSSRLPVTNMKFLKYLEEAYDHKKKKFQFLEMEGYEDFVWEPITGLTFEQVIDYCKWRTNFNQDQNKFHEEYFLPTPQLYEWIIKEIEPRDSIVLDQSAFNYRGSANHHSPLNSLKKKTIRRIDQIKESGAGTKAVGVTHYYYSNQYVMFNILGNVSEMTSTKGVSKGGSYLHTASDGLNATDIPYSKQQPWLGFRCVLIRKINKEKGR